MLLPGVRLLILVLRSSKKNQWFSNWFGERLDLDKRRLICRFREVV